MSSLQKRKCRKRALAPHIKLYDHLVITYGVTAAHFIGLIERYVESWDGLSVKKKMRPMQFGDGIERDGKVWIYSPQYQWAKEMNVDPSTVYRLIKKLREQGVIDTAPLSGEPYNSTHSICLNVRPSESS